MSRLRVGACLSLTGRFGRFGRQAAHGLRVWQRLTEADVEFEIQDDGSDPELFAQRFPRVASRHEWRALILAFVVGLGAVVYRPAEFVLMGVALVYVAVAISVRVAGADRSDRP